MAAPVTSRRRPPRAPRAADGRRFLPWLALALGLLLTAAALLGVLRSERQQQLQVLREEARIVAGMVERRVGRWGEILHGMRGLFSASSAVHAEEFSEYYRQLDLPRRYPGFLALQFLAYVPGDQRASFEAAIQGDAALRPAGAGPFRIHPPGERPDYHVTLYIEPLAGNEAAYGFDAAHDANRRAAFERARDTGELTASGPLRLVQRPQDTGYILRSAIYRGGTVVDTKEARRRAHIGMGSVVLAMDEFVTAIIDAPLLARLDLRLHDLGWVEGPLQPPGPATLLFDSAGPRPPPTDEAIEVIEQPLGGRLWRFEFRQQGGSAAAPSAPWVPWLVGGLGLLASGLAFRLVSAELSVRTALEDRVAQRTAQLAGANRSLAESELRLDLALAGADLGLWHWDVASGQVACNERWLGLRGATRGDRAPDVAWWEARIHPDDRATATTAMAAHVEGRTREYSVEYRICLPDGGVRWVLDRGCAVERDAQGRALRVTGTNLDISDRKRAEEAYVQAETARRLAAAKDEFVGRMSHELRTPLNAILGFAQLIEMTPQAEPARRAEHVGQIRRAGEHLLALVSDLLDVAAIEAGRISLEPQPVPLGPAVQEVLDLLRPMAEVARVRLAPVQGEGTALADRTRLRQVLLNLVSNAIKYNRPDGELRVQIEAAGPLVHLGVHDTGPGMTADQLDRLFQPFERLDARRSGVVGTGLGLVVTRRLVQLMAGQIQVHSEPGQGSVFVVSLPAATEPP
ncbi:CHASE domain-containing protein [Ideonella sp.]|uniref:CHASE domain-containing sensor histidine kinase n=1 Tax=Ideonella sp. TaxID=1929293 RepID=UPI0035AFD15F